MKTLQEVSLNKGEYGGGFSAVEYFDGAPRYIRITDIDENGSLKDSIVAPSGNESEWQKYKLQPGDLLFARSGATVGKTFLYDENYGECVYAGYLIRFRPDTTIVDPKYLYYSTRTPSYNAWVANKQNVVAQPNINAKQYGQELNIPLPPLEKQKKIASILDAADAYRQKTKALIEKYDELTQSLFLDMFGDPLSNTMDWECKKFENFTTKYNQGVNTTTEKIKYEDDGTFPIIRAGEVGKGSLSFDSVVWVDHENESRIKETCKPIKGDVLYANIGANLGTACLVETNRAFGIAWNVFRIQLKEQVNRTFFVHQLNSEWVRRVVWSKVKTATVPFISGKQIAELNFINPPAYIQSDFEKRVQAIEEQKTQAQASLAQAEDLFNCLLQRAFKGKLTS